VALSGRGAVEVAGRRGGVAAGSCVRVVGVSCGRVCVRAKCGGMPFCRVPDLALGIRRVCRVPVMWHSA